jgi:hypothetical protein
MDHTALKHTPRRDKDFEVAIGWEAVNQQFGAYVLAQPGTDDQEIVFNSYSPQPQALFDELRRYTDIPDGLEHRLWADYLFNIRSPEDSTSRLGQPLDADSDTGEDRTYELSWPTPDGPTLDGGADLG